MNKTETLAFKWLKEKGYKDNEITFIANKSPDFICNDRKRYEVKFLYGNMIIFSNKQLKSLQPEDVILVFDRVILKDKFSWKDKDKSLFKIHCPHTEDPTVIIVKVETRRFLNKLKYEWDCKTIDEVIIKMIEISSKVSNASELKGGKVAAKTA